jgi:hypothetical protein
MGCTHSNISSIKELQPIESVIVNRIKCIEDNCKSNFVYRDTKYCYPHAVKNLPEMKEAHNKKIKETRIKNRNLDESRK